MKVMLQTMLVCTVAALLLIATLLLLSSCPPLRVKRFDMQNLPHFRGKCAETCLAGDARHGTEEDPRALALEG